MKIRKRYILLIILCLLPFYKIIHFDDFCIDDADYLMVAFLSIIVFITFLVIVFFNLYHISLRKELFNYRPLLIFGVFLVALFLGLKYPNIFLLKIAEQQFIQQIDQNTSINITLFKDKTFILKTKKLNGFCSQYGIFSLEKDTLTLNKNQKFETASYLDSLYFFDRINKILVSKSPNFPSLILKD